MKWRGKYLVWVLVALLVVLVAYFWNSREHFGNQCWSEPKPMSAETGYLDIAKNKGELFDIKERWEYLKYIGNQMMAQGKCGNYTNVDECANYKGSIGLTSLDMAKNYCSTVNCSAIIVLGGRDGTEYLPIKDALVSTPPVGPDGKPPPDSAFDFFKLIVPVPCASPVSDTKKAAPVAPAATSLVSVSSAPTPAAAAAPNPLIPMNCACTPGSAVSAPV